MKVNLKATRTELNNEIKEYVQKKMDMLDKYLGKIKVVNCDFEVEVESGNGLEGKNCRAEANLQVPGELLRVEKRAENLFKAIDKVKDHLELVIKKYKGKKITKERRN
ncbi:ribosome-associated translation inhibitor RaiA [bacterium]|nr:ribosome-associated translation inhibitor RaiA [bacterium]